MIRGLKGRCLAHELTDSDYAWTVRVAAGWCRDRDVLVDDEIRQEARLALAQAAGRYSRGFGASFRTFAGKRVIGAVKDLIRKRLGTRSRQARFDNELLSLDFPCRAPDSEWLPLSAFLPHGDGDPAKAAEARETLERILESAGDERDREVVRMRLDGKTYAEIGAVLGVTESRVCQLVQRIRRRLRKALLE